MPIITRYITVRLDIQVPDSDEDHQESANDVLTDCDYHFKCADHHKIDGCEIIDTEICDYGDDE
jgi:hypothetical protein